MARQRCIYCAQPQGQEHSYRCAVPKLGSPALYEEDAEEMAVERDRYKSALTKIRDDIYRELLRQERKDSGEGGLTLPRVTLRLAYDHAGDALSPTSDKEDSPHER